MWPAYITGTIAVVALWGNPPSTVFTAMPPHEQAASVLSMVGTVAGIWNANRVQKGVEK
jgi:hypothetical protein